jgi:proline iminopeptidase
MRRDIGARGALRFSYTAMLVLYALVTAGCAATGRALIRHSEYLTIEGARLFLETHGPDQHAPVLLWLHGGPGGAERPLFRYFNSDLEDHFVVAYWDQRGAGRSFDTHADPHLLNIARHLADLDRVLDHLRQGLGKQKILLIGHSWGAALGLLYAQAHPDKVSALIAVNPLVSTREQQQAQYDFVLDEALRRNDSAALARLQGIGPPPHKTAAEQLDIERLADRYGGVFHNKPNYLWVTIAAIFSGLVTPWEIPSFIRANDISLKAMHEELLGLDLPRSVPCINVPVFFFLGRYDRHLDATLAANYFASLGAPVKQLTWFENSAHNIPFEEPDRFNGSVLSAVQLVARACQELCQ